MSEPGVIQVVMPQMGESLVRNPGHCERPIQLKMNTDSGGC